MKTASFSSSQKNNISGLM